MNNDVYDWCIVGAGPAGSTVARLLSSYGRVLLLDRRRLDLDFDFSMTGKCCGGLLAPDAQCALAQFGLALPEKTLGGAQLFAVRALDIKYGIERFYQRFYLNLDREAFDRWLAELAVKAGATSCFGAEWLAFENGVLRYRCDGEYRSAQCRYLIAADGASSTVRRKSISGKNKFTGCNNVYVSIQEEYPYDGNSPFFSAFFDSELTDFYGWSIPKKDTVLMGAAFAPGADSIRKFEVLKQRLETRGLKFGNPLRRAGSMLLRPCRTSDIWLGEDNVFAIGEAAGWISPSSAEGFSYAFHSARLLAELFAHNPLPTLQDYRRKSESLFLNLRLKILKSPFMYYPPLRNFIMRTGITAIETENLIGF